MMEKIEFSIKTYVTNDFLGKDESIRLPYDLNKKVWKYVMKHKQFCNFLTKSLSDLSKRTNNTGQTVISAKVRLVIDSNDISSFLRFNTAEGTSKKYNNEDKILLSDFDDPSSLALEGMKIKKLIDEHIKKENRKVVYSKLVIIGSFIFPCFLFFINDKTIFNTILILCGILLIALIISEVYSKRNNNNLPYSFKMAADILNSIQNEQSKKDEITTFERRRM